jgi:threonyl-tRNA synthetase
MTTTADAPIRVTLPDGSVRELAPGTTGAGLAAAIGAGLARAALAVKVDGELRDLGEPLPDGATIAIVTDRDPVLRHSGAHILATAVRACAPMRRSASARRSTTASTTTSRSTAPFTPEDLEAFEAEMRKVIAEKYPFVRAEVSQDEARRFADDPLKLERWPTSRADEVISVYTDGPFVDLCRGPHVPRHLVPQALQAAAARRAPTGAAT